MLSAEMNNVENREVLDLKNNRKELSEHEKFFSKIYYDNRDDIFLFIKRSLLCESTAMDIMQDTFINFFKMYPKIRNDLSARKLLFTIAKHLVINNAVSSYNRRVSQGPDVGLYHQSKYMSVEKQMEYKEDEKKIEMLLKSLSQSDRMIITLRYVHKMNLTEIGKLMDISTATASRRLKVCQKTLMDYAEKNNITV